MLSTKEKQLPIVEGVPGDTIVERLMNGWAPEHDTLDLSAYLTKHVRRIDEQHSRVKIFLKFPDSRKASEAARALTKGSYKVRRRGRRLEVQSPEEARGMNASGVTSYEDGVLKACRQFGPSYEGNEVW